MKNKNIIIRTTVYVIMFIVNAVLSILVPITASPSDAMAVPLAAILGGVIAIVGISILDISSVLKFCYIPISIVMILIGSLIYTGNAMEYGMLYGSIVAVMQLVVVLISIGIRFLLKKNSGGHIW